MNNKSSNCVYCGLPVYGKGCRYAPKSIHVHATPNKCMYCGLNLTGPGCRFSPSKVHVKFGDFGFIQKEDYSDTFILSYFLKSIQVNEFKESITSKIKHNIKKLIESSKKMIIEEALLTATCTNKFDKNLYEAELEYKGNVELVVKEMFNIINKYKNILPSETIEKHIIESFLNKDDVK